MINNHPSPESMTINNLVEFVVTHRRGKAFSEWTEEEIARTLYSDYLKKQLAVFFREGTGELLGLAHGYAEHSTKVFHVSNVLIKDREKNVIRGLLFILDQTYPGYTIQGTRYGNVKHYETPRFKRHLNNLT